MEERGWGICPKETWARGKEESKKVRHLEKSVSVMYWKGGMRSPIHTWMGKKVLV